MRGRIALVTGVSRRAGIGFAVACRLAAYGASVFLHHHRPHDLEQSWGGDDLDAVVAEVAEYTTSDAGIAHLDGDLTEPEAPERVMRAAIAEFGRVDILVCNHALSGCDGDLASVDADMLDRHWATNTRSSILLAQAFAACHDGRDGGRIVFMTSGQQLGPMPGEVAYAAAKGALAEITMTLSDELADSGITLNTVNPGPVDTGYLDDRSWEYVRPMFPLGRFGQPDDPARLIAWLATDEAHWITGQVINTEGGFGRWRPRGRAEP